MLQIQKSMQKSKSESIGKRLANTIVRVIIKLSNLAFHFLFGLQLRALHVALTRCLHADGFDFHSYQTGIETRHRRSSWRIGDTCLGRIFGTPTIARECRGYDEADPVYERDQYVDPRYGFRSLESRRVIIIRVLPVIRSAIMRAAVAVRGHVAERNGSHGAIDDRYEVQDGADDAKDEMADHQAFSALRIDSAPECSHAQSATDHAHDADEEQYAGPGEVRGLRQYADHDDSEKEVDASHDQFGYGQTQRGFGPFDAAFGLVADLGRGHTDRSRRHNGRGWCHNDHGRI